jgi:hypothetical protein
MKGIGINDFLDKQFKEYPFTGAWADTLGIPEQNFKMLVFGHPKNGKTECCIQLSKYLAGFGKVYYNSYEQGISKTLQDALKRNNMREVAGKVIFGHKEPLAVMHKRLKGNGSPRFVILDSRDYMNLTDEQFKSLIEAFPRKSFILICWEKSGAPKSEHAQNIAFMVDIILHVANFKAYPTSRFGGNQPYTIWDRKAAPGTQLTLLSNP